MELALQRFCAMMMVCQERRLEFGKKARLKISVVLLSSSLASPGTVYSG